MSLAAENIRAIARIMTTADGGCSVCVYSLLVRFGREFPGWRGEIEKVWDEFSQGNYGDLEYE